MRIVQVIWTKYFVEWVQTHEEILWCLVTMSIASFLLSLMAVPWIVVKIPSDYFSNRIRHRPRWADHHPLIRTFLLLGKNIGGLILLLLGIAMLVLPGQGMLTILMGIVLLDFPYKYRMERWVVSRHSVLRSINWLRKRAGRVPIILDD